MYGRGAPEPREPDPRIGISKFAGDTKNKLREARPLWPAALRGGPKQRDTTRSPSPRRAWDPFRRDAGLVATAARLPGPVEPGRADPHAAGRTSASCHPPRRRRSRAACSPRVSSAQDRPVHRSPRRRRQSDGGGGILPLSCSQQLDYVTGIGVATTLPTFQPTIALMVPDQIAP